MSKKLQVLIIDDGEDYRCGELAHKILTTFDAQVTRVTPDRVKHNVTTTVITLDNTPFNKSKNDSH